MKNCITVVTIVLLSLMTARNTSAECNQCVKGSGCEAPCIDAGTCACNVSTNNNVSIGGSCKYQTMSAYQMTVSTNASNSFDVDLTAGTFAGFSITPSSGCPGYAICVTDRTGNGDVWVRNYTGTDGHEHINVGSEGDGTSVSGIVNMWPIIGTGYSTEPFGCGSACNIQAEYTEIQSVPGQGLQVTPPIVNITPTNSFNCIYSMEGDLGLGAAQGGIGALYETPNVVASADDPNNGDSAFVYMKLLSLRRPTGPFPITRVAVSAADRNVAVGTNCRAFGLVQDYSNSAFIFQSGNTVFLGPTPSNSVAEGMCLLNQ